MSVLLYGDDELRIDERIQALRETLDPQALSTTVIDVPSSSAGEISTACQSMPFLGGQRVVVLRQPITTPRRTGEQDEQPDEESAGRVPWAELAAIFKTCPPTTAIVLRHIGGLAPGHYARKAVRSLGWDEEGYSIPRGGELLAWLTERARARSAELQPDAAELLLDVLHPGVWKKASTRFDTSSPDTRLIASELDKLIAASDGPIDRELVRSLIVDRGGYVAFELNNAVFAGQVNRALAELEKMLEAGQPAEMIVGSLASEATAIAALRHTREFGLAAVAAAAGVSEGRLKALGSRGGGIPLSAHRRIALLLREADESIKAGRETASTIITPLVAGIAEAVRMSAGPSRQRP